MPNPNFTPLSREELRELWNAGYPHLAQTDAWVEKAMRLILSAIWWEAMNDKIEWQYHLGRCAYDADWVLLADGRLMRNVCQASERHGWSAQDWFLAKLREIEIDWREDG